MITALRLTPPFVFPGGGSCRLSCVSGARRFHSIPRDIRRCDTPLAQERRAVYRARGVFWCSLARTNSDVCCTDNTPTVYERIFQCVREDVRELKNAQTSTVLVDPMPLKKMLLTLLKRCRWT